MPLRYLGTAKKGLVIRNESQLSQSMKFTISIQQNIGIFNLEGSLIGENDGIAITEAFTEQLDNGIKNFVVNLETLKHINSSGLGVLLTLLTKSRKAGGELVLVKPSDFIKNLLLITKLNSIFKIYDSVEAAVKSYDS